MSATILCVYENREVARDHSETLESEGYHVICALDGRQALEQLKRQQPDFVVLDLQLSRQDGLEVLASIRQFEACQSLPVLLVSRGELSQDTVTRAKGLGAIGVEVGPLPVERLLSRIARYMKPPEVEPGASQIGHIATSGSLPRVPIPELLNTLRRERLTGVVMLDHGKKKKAIEFRDGWPISVKSNLISECLGGYLVEHEICSPLELSESVKRMRAGEGLQGEILVAMDVLDEDAMIAVLREHALEKFFEIFHWRDGGYLIRPEAHVQRGSRLGIEGHPADLIMEGVRRGYPLKQIDRYFESHADEYLVPRASGEEQMSQVDLSEMELTWIRQFDFSATLGGLLAQDEWVRRLAFGCLSIDFLAVDTFPGDDLIVRDIVERVADGVAPNVTVDEEKTRAELAELANRMQNRDHYGVLDLSQGADDEEVRVAYACLAKRTHPDRFNGSSRSVRQLASQVFARIAEANAALSTADGRRAYAQELARGRTEEAAEDEGRRALQAEMEFQRGEAKMSDRDYEGALLCFGRAMENFPAEGEYRSHYGWCLYLCHPDNDVMLGEALEHCREGLKLAKDREKPYLLLGRLYKAMGKAGAAKKMFSRAVEIKPQCVEAMRELRIMNMRRGKSQGIVQGVSQGVMKRIFRR